MKKKRAAKESFMALERNILAWVGKEQTIRDILIKSASTNK